MTVLLGDVLLGRKRVSRERESGRGDEKNQVVSFSMTLSFGQTDAYKEQGKKNAFVPSPVDYAYSPKGRCLERVDRPSSLIENSPPLDCIF